MGQQPSKSVEDKVRIVLAVLRGEIPNAAAAPREGTSAMSISKWRDLFLAGGQRALEAGARGGPSSRERQLAGEIVGEGREAYGAGGTRVTPLSLSMQERPRYRRPASVLGLTCLA